MPPNTSPARQRFELATVRQHLSGAPRVRLRSAEMILAMSLATRQLLQAKSQLKANLLLQAKQPVLEEKNLDFASQKAKQLMLLLVAPARPLDLFRPQVLQEQQLQLAKD